MKDALMKVTPIPSCLADSSEAAGKLPVIATEDLSASNEGYRRVRRSATMIGLAISMSATSSMLLPNQNDAAIATESVALAPIPTSLSSTTPAQSDAPTPSSKATKLSPPAIKHEVQQGESLWQLSQDYRVSPEAIAASNNLAPRANLLVGQSIKIPPLKGSANAAKQVSSNSEAIAGQVDQLLQPQNQSLERLKETRQSLKNSLAQMPSEELRRESNLTEVPTQISAAPQPSPTLVASATSSPDQSERQAIPIPVPAPETEAASPLDRQKEAQLKQPMPIATAAPVTDTGSSTSPEPISTPLPQATTFPTAKRQKAHGTNAPESISVPSPQTQETSNLERPRPIAVPSPETAVVPKYQPQETILTTPKPVENQQPQATSTLPSLEQPQPPVTSPAKQVYQIQPGDTLNSIARRHGLSVSELIKANNIRNPNLIKINQPLIIPNASVATRPSAPNFVPGMPLGGDRVPVAQPQSKNSVPVVTASVPANLNENTRVDIQTQGLNHTNQFTGGEAIAIPVQSPTATYTQKLKDDVVKLQQEYQTEPRNNLETTTDMPQTLAVEVNTPTSVNARTRNSEWDNDRRQSPIKPRYQPQAQVIGAAPTGVENYNDMLGTSVGETVGPDLPPLSVPEQYLPDSPTRFNGYIWPTKGVLTSGYGWRWGRMHKGVDIAAPIGTPVMAAAGGEVVSAGWNSGGYGNLVKIKHPNGSVTLYAHNNRILVRQGQKVEQGQQISEMGSTGYSTGPHLHFEVHPTGKGAVNPVAYLPKQRR